MRVDVDDSSERMNKKIRSAQLQKIPYMLVVGDKEAEDGLVAVRTRENEDRGAVPVAEFRDNTLELIRTRSMDI
jgi:threonyl-tRNA synthetase